MKGIMKVAVAAVAVALCGAAKADYMDWLQWSFSGVEASPSSSTPTVGSYTAYFFDGAKYNSVFSMISDKTVTKEGLSSLAFDSAANTATDSSYLSSWKVVKSYEGNSTTFPSTAFALIFDADFNNYMVVKSDKTNTEIIGQYKLPVYDSTGTTLQRTLYGYGWGSQTGNAWVAVPEPTSGLLLLVGLSAIALKRKRAA